MKQLLTVIALTVLASFVNAEDASLRGAIMEKMEQSTSEKVKGHCDDMEMPGTFRSKCDFICPCRDDTAEGTLSCHPGFIGIPQRCYHSPRRFEEPCAAGYSCGSGLSCQPGSHQCYHSPRLLNEPCSAGYSCQSGLSCSGNSGQCLHKPRQEGEDCDIWVETCGTGMTCNGKCEWLLPVGSACNEASDCRSGRCCEPHTGICHGAGVYCVATIDACTCGGTDPPTVGPTNPPNYASCLVQKQSCEDGCHGGDCGCDSIICVMPPTPPPPTIPPPTNAPTNAPTAPPTNSAAYVYCRWLQQDCDNNCGGGDCGCTNDLAFQECLRTYRP